jgi:hypothetical protein
MSLPRFASFLAATVLAVALPALAQTPPPPRVDPTPPPLPDFSGDQEVEPQVTIIRRENDTVEEVRVRGELRYVRVTPRGGRSYYLIPDTNTGGTTYIRRDSLDPALKVPMWVLFSF